MTNEPSGNSPDYAPGTGPGPQEAHPPGYGPVQPSDLQQWQVPTPAGRPSPSAFYPAALPVEQPGSSLHERSLFVLVAAICGVVFGIVGGYLWSVIAEPPVGVLTDRGVFLTTELAYNDAVVMSLWFLLIGIGLGVLAGIGLGLVGRRHGVAVVVAALVLTAIACALSAWLGIEVFGPDPQAQVAESSVGDPITAALDISTKIAYLGWPIGGLVGVLVAVSTWTRPKVPTAQWVSSNVSPH